MRVLIVEDNFTDRKILQKILSEYGECDIAVDGQEAIDAFKTSWMKCRPYDLICMDIMMPKVNGLQALKMIRETEKEKDINESERVRIIMITAVDDPKIVYKACNLFGVKSYIVKPIDKKRLLDEVRKLGLISESYAKL
jgi:two-component system chemotaxis response regulator CheY